MFTKGNLCSAFRQIKAENQRSPILEFHGRVWGGYNEHKPLSLVASCCFSNGDIHRVARR